MDIHVELAAEELFSIGPVAITNSMLTMFLVMGVLLLVFGLIARGASLIPGRVQSAAEMIIEFMLGLVEATAGKRYGRRIFPLIAGMFIFILFANFFSVLPGVGTIVLIEDEDEAHTEEAVAENDAEATPEGEIADTAVADATDGTPAAGAVNDQGGDEEGTSGAVAATTEESGDDEEHHGPTRTPIFRPATADINMTLAMALLTFVVVQIAGVSAHGVVGRIKHMADPPFIFPIEVISELSRIVSLSARLFGNVFAGELLLGVMYAMANAIKIALVPVLFPVVFIGLELLFGAIQALVFALLTLIYITLAAAGHDDHEHDDAHDHEQAGAN